MILNLESANNKVAHITLRKYDIRPEIFTQLGHFLQLLKSFGNKWRDRYVEKLIHG